MIDFINFFYKFLEYYFPDDLKNKHVLWSCVPIKACSLLFITASYYTRKCVCIYLNNEQHWLQVSNVPT